MKKWFTSKKFAAMVAGVIVSLGNAVFGWNLPEDTVNNVIFTIMAYIGGQSIADGLSGGATSSMKKD